MESFEKESDAEWLEASMVVLTDAAIKSRYGPLQIPMSTLRSLAQQMNDQMGHMTAQHDPSMPIRVRRRRAFVEARSDASGWALRLDAEVHREDWEAWQRIVQAAGAPGGMSVGLTEPLVVPRDAHSVLVAGDAADFDDDELLALAASLPGGASVAVSRLYQFAADPEPVRLVVELVGSVLQAVPANMIADWLVRLIDHLRGKAASSKRPSVLDVRCRRSPGGVMELDMRLEVQDEAVVQRGLAVIDRFLESLDRDDE